MNKGRASTRKGERVVPIRTLLYGYGYWGTRLGRVLTAHPAFDVVGLVETSAAAARRFKDEYPHIPVHDPDLVEPAGLADLAVVATTASTHHLVAKRLLSLDLDVVVSKPLGLSVREAKELTELAEERDLQLMVDLTYLFTPAVQRIREVSKDGAIGFPSFVSSNRSNLGLIQPDCSVVWDLAVHDFAIIEYVLGATPSWVSAHTGTHELSTFASTASITCQFGETLASIFVTWESSVKVRSMVFGGTQGVLVFDDTRIEGKLLHVPGEIVETTNRALVEERSVSYSVGEPTPYLLAEAEALMIEFDHIARQCRERKDEMQTSKLALHGVAAAEACELSAKNAGCLVRVDMK